MRIILESVVESIASRADGSIAIKIGTQELDASKAGELFQLRGKYCKILLSDTNITKLEEELIDNTQITSTKKNRTASQRLRAVLFRINEQSGGDEETFEKFYKEEMERIIESYKAKLE